MVDEGLGLKDYSTVMLNPQVVTERRREEGEVFRSCRKKNKKRLKPDCA